MCNESLPVFDVHPKLFTYPIVIKGDSFFLQIFRKLARHEKSKIFDLFSNFKMIDAIQFTLSIIEKSGDDADLMDYFRRRIREFDPIKFDINESNLPDPGLYINATNDTIRESFDPL